MRELFGRHAGEGASMADGAPWRARRWTGLGVALCALVLALVGLTATGSFADPGHDGEELDPVRNEPLPCEAVQTSGSVARSSKNIEHLANRCGLVGTDVEFQSRKDARGKVHDYAFVGTIGTGLRIFDVTNPANPRPAGQFNDPGYQNDVQVEGNTATLSYDGLAGEDSNASTCLKTKYPAARGQGVDILRLRFSPKTARFRVENPTCIANPPGGAHNATLQPRGMWMTISNPSSDWAVDVIDLRGYIREGKEPRHSYRYIDASRQDTDAERASKCPEGASFECRVVKRPDGTSAFELWRPHDVSFSRDGETMYVAALESTFIVDARRALEGQIRTVSIIPNDDSDPADTSNDIQLSHQADVSADGKILVVSDERGGGVSNTSCNTPTGEQQIIGALHFYAVAPLDGVEGSADASPSNPKKLGIYVNPNPTLEADPLQSALGDLRLERGCTVHVFRLGGNGTGGPGAIQPGFDGVSKLPNRQLTTAWYGAGTWHVSFAGPPSDADGIEEDDQTTWGNTLGWNVMPGADTWSAKEYKGHVYTGDIARGFDVFEIE